MSGVPKRLYGVDRIPVGSDLNPARPYTETLWDRSLIVSENHRRYPSGKWSGGGPFYTWQRIITHGGQKTIPVFRIVDKGNYTMLGVVGSPLHAPDVVMTPPSWTSVASTLSGIYATGYNKARPGNPVASLAQFVAELRDLPRLPFQNVFAKHGLKILVPFKDIPRRLRDYHLRFRDLGSEYLNVVFGWLPFISDLRKMFYLYQTVDKRLTDIVRQNGKFIRRRATIRDDTSVSQTESIYNFPYANVYGAPGEIDSPGKTIYTVTTRTSTKEWFAGSFRYMLFEPESSQWTTRCKAHLFGGVPTPALLWELMPYSWLIDWFSNVGDVIQNASPNAVDNLTMKYSYVMRHTRTSTEWRASVSHGSRDTSSRRWPAVDHAWTSSDIVESKSRSGGGNPFGLNVQLADLSSAQLAILAALGISRASVK